MKAEAETVLAQQVFNFAPVFSYDGRAAEQLKAADINCLKGKTKKKGRNYVSFAR